MLKVIHSTPNYYITAEPRGRYIIVALSRHHDWRPKQEGDNIESAAGMSNLELILADPMTPSWQFWKMNLERAVGKAFDSLRIRERQDETRALDMTVAQNEIDLIISKERVLAGLINTITEEAYDE